MNAVRTFFLIVIGLLLAVSITATTVAVSLNRTILKPYSTVSYLKEAGFHEQFEAALPGMLIPEARGGIMEYVDNMMKEMLSQAIGKLIDGQWIAAKMKFMETELWDYILRKDESLSPIDISDVKEHFIQGLGARLDEMERLKQIPPGMNKSLIMKELGARVGIEVNWAEIFGVKTDKLENLRENYERLQSGIRRLFIIDAGLLLVLALVSFRWRRTLAYAGTAGIVSGLAAFLPQVAWGLYQPLAEERVQKLELSGIQAHFEENIPRLADLLAQDALGSLLTAAVILIACGAAMLAGARLHFHFPSKSV